MSEHAAESRRTWAQILELNLMKGEMGLEGLTIGRSSLSGNCTCSKDMSGGGGERESSAERSPLISCGASCVEGCWERKGILKFSLLHMLRQEENKEFLIDCLVLE